MYKFQGLGIDGAGVAIETSGDPARDATTAAAGQIFADAARPIADAAAGPGAAFTQLVNQVGGFVQANPFLSLAIAGGIVYLLRGAGRRS